MEIVTSGAEVIMLDTVGKNTAAIKKYIQNQLKEDLRRPDVISRVY